jgi:predicted transposase/invertase (TIGR01784 family)
MGSLAEKWENQGIHKGAYQEKQEIAIRLLKKNTSVVEIAEITGLSLEEVKILKSKISR